MILGIFIGNAWESNGQGHPIGMDAGVWRFLTIVGFMLIWNRYTANSDRGKWWAIVARTTGVALLVYLAAIYREGDDLHGLQIRWWILGTLGWAYLVAGIAYLALRKHRAAILGCLALAVLMYVGDQSGAFNRLTWLGPVRNYVSFGTLLGVWPAMTLAGVLVGMLFMEGSTIVTPRNRVAWILIFAMGLFAAGFLLRPLYGCSKGGSTPTWALYSVAISCIICAGFYLLVDVWRKRTCVAVLLPVGTNAMLAYLLHEMLHAVLPLLNIRFESAGAMGIVRAAVFAIGVLMLTTYCTNRRILRLGL
jgi:predicted acyltransferase